MRGSGEGPAVGLSPRWLLETGVLCLAGVLVFRALGVEPYLVPTGSMAPALMGVHKASACPRCGYPVVVGRHDDAIASESSWLYRAAVCPNCGCDRVGLASAPEEDGDRVLVNKATFAFRKPRRWEMVVFRRPAERKAFVKRVVGLPGETIAIRDGDIFADTELARKSLEECRAVRIPVFDQNFSPQTGGWRPRWLAQPEAETACAIGPELCLDVTTGADPRWLVYRNWSLDEAREQVLDDDCSYNGGRGRGLHPVHDFMMACDVVVTGSSGWLALGLDDGRDRPVATIPIGAGGGISLTRPQGPPVVRSALTLVPGKSFHVELSFFDRRFALAVDGACLESVDFPPTRARHDVARPARIGVRGAKVVVHNFRLYRDIHYVEAGGHGLGPPVRLGAREYFVLGDNSPDSDDSRFWENPGVAETNLLGRPFLVHAPGRVQGLGAADAGRGLGWGQLRWLR